MRLSTTVRITNDPANHFVASAKRASRDFALFLAKYVSFWPLNAASPEFFPDWSMIIQIRAMLIRSWMITNISFKISTAESVLSKYRLRNHGKV